MLLQSITRQPTVGIATSLTALACLTVSWQQLPPSIQGSTGWLALTLVLALVLSYRFPVHLLRGSKACMGNVALYLMALLLPPSLACLAAGTGVAIGTWLMRTERGLYLSDIATDAGRWLIVVLTSSVAAHMVPDVGERRAAAMALAGILLWTGDTLTAPLIYGPITHDPPWRIVRTLVQEGGQTEAYQYLLGFLGALAEMQLPGAIVLLLVPILPLHFAFKHTKETQDSTRQVLEAMADAVDLRDPYTGGHSQRVAHYSAQILAAMQLQGPEVDLIVSAARVHDIGKIGTPDSVLLKDGNLTPEERAVMEEHPVHGAQLLARYRDFTRGAALVRGHHERWDGQGYPDGLAGTAIPFGARIIAVADSFDAMTSDRPYRRGMPLVKAMDILRKGSGVQWDAEVVNVFLGALEFQAEKDSSSCLSPDAAVSVPATVLAQAKLRSNQVHHASSFPLPMKRSRSS